jgi:hypothetical protein
VRLARALVVASVVALAACGGGGTSSGTTLPPQSNGFCDPGTQVSISNPQPNSTGVSPSIGRIEIVANGNNNTLYQSYTNFDVLLRDQFGTIITGSQLSLAPPDKSYQPFSSDFYYNSNVSGLQFGTTYQAFLNIYSSPCQQPAYLGSFST